jgi:hypothetical protein
MWHQGQQLPAHRHPKQRPLVLAVPFSRQFMPKLGHVVTFARKLEGAVQSFVCVHAGTYSMHPGRNGAEHAGCGQ